MNYKFQDILKIVIPGLYLAFAISVVIYMTDSDGQYVPTELLNMLKTPFANAIAVFLPFGGYIIGYLLNVIASGFEINNFIHIKASPLMNHFIFS